MSLVTTFALSPCLVTSALAYGVRTKESVASFSLVKYLATTETRGAKTEAKKTTTTRKQYFFFASDQFSMRKRVGIDFMQYMAKFPADTGTKPQKYEES
jgi:hypothetical protein